MGLKYLQPLFPFLLGMALILASHTFFAVGFVNSVLQALLFTLVVCIPIWRTGRISYVDIQRWSLATFTDRDLRSGHCGFTHGVRRGQHVASRIS